jgi:hypothetical protein
MTEAMRARPDVYTAGGVLALDVPTYVERVADSELFEELRRRRYCYILTSRQMGKSSLIVRTRQRLCVSTGVPIGITDFEPTIPRNNEYSITRT